MYTVGIAQPVCHIQDPVVAYSLKGNLERPSRGYFMNYAFREATVPSLNGGRSLGAMYGKETYTSKGVA